MADHTYSFMSRPDHGTKDSTSAISNLGNNYIINFI